MYLVGVPATVHVMSYSLSKLNIIVRLMVALLGLQEVIYFIASAHVCTYIWPSGPLNDSCPGLGSAN